MNNNEGKISRFVPMDELMPLITERLAEGQSVKFSPQGVSMLPMLREGRDTVTLSPVPSRLKKYDLPLYRSTEGKYTLHRVIKADDDKYVLIGDNLFVYEKEIDHGQMIALVTSFIRGGREHSTDELPYKLYCRFWYFIYPLRLFWHKVKNKLRRLQK